jgi:hypothetical protein
MLGGVPVSDPGKRRNPARLLRAGLPQTVSAEILSLRRFRLQRNTLREVLLEQLEDSRVLVGP